MEFDAAWVPSPIRNMVTPPLQKALILKKNNFLPKDLHQKLLSSFSKASFWKRLSKFSLPLRSEDPYSLCSILMLPILQIQHSEKYETKNYLRMNIANFFFFFYLKTSQHQIWMKIWDSSHKKALALSPFLDIMRSSQHLRVLWC